MDLKTNGDESMTLEEAIQNRHSVRSYSEKPIENEIKEQLEEVIKKCNEQGKLHIQLVLNEPKAFDGFMAHYGKFTGVTNYFAMIGPKGKDLDEKIGYYGEYLALYAQQLGLNTCWVALTYGKNKNAFEINKGEKLVLVIAVGYGNTQGIYHKSKTSNEVSNLSEASPEWFRRGVEVALLAPTTQNRQRFILEQKGNTVTTKAGSGPYAKLDLGIIKQNFEIAAGKENFQWQ